MNGDGEILVAQDRRIWNFYLSAYHLTISDCFNPGLLKRTRAAFITWRRRTVSEVRNLIEHQVENNGTNETIASSLSLCCYKTGTHLIEQECTLLGQSCQPLVHHLQKLEIAGDEWTDMQRSCIVRHMSLPWSTIKVIRLHGNDAEMPMTIRTLSDESPASLQTLELKHVVFTSVDCQFLGQMISNKERALDCLILWFCSLPCLVDFVKLIAGFVKDKIPSDHCEFRDCTVKDTSIPTHDGADYLEFVRIFGVFWKRRRRNVKGIYHRRRRRRRRRRRGLCLEESALDMINYFRPMQRAGLSRLLLPTGENMSVIEMCQPVERGEWVKVFGHEAVNDRVDLLFHILLLNPEVCILE